MEKLDGPETYFICHANYIYTASTISSEENPGKLYLECYHKHCSARAIKKQGKSLIIRTGRHYHQPDVELLENLRFKCVLWTRSLTETTSPAQIFWEEEIRYPNAASKLGLNSAKRLMLRYRKEQPPVPSSLDEAATILYKPHCRRYALEVGPRQRSYLRERREGCLYFVSPTIQEFAIQEKDLHLIIDTPFKIVPENGVSHYLFVIHWMRGHHFYPVVVCLMPNTTRQTYIGVLEYTKHLLGIPNITCILCDYNVALRMAVKEVFDRIPLMSCWFYYARNVLFAARQMQVKRGLMKEMDVIRMGMSVALLPADRIPEGLDFVCQRIGMWRFTKFMYRQFVNTGISVYGFDSETNIAIGSLHEQMLKFFAQEHPTFWDFILTLQEYEQRSDFLMNQKTKPKPSNPTWTFYDTLHRKIMKAQRQFEEDDNLEHFLTETGILIRGMEKMFTNRIIDKFPEEGEMVPNSIQGKEQVRKENKKAVQDGSIQASGNPQVDAAQELEGVPNADKTAMENSPLPTELTENVLGQPDGNGALRRSNRQRARQLHNSADDLGNTKGLGNMFIWYKGKKSYRVKQKKKVTNSNGKPSALNHRNHCVEPITAESSYDDGHEKLDTVDQANSTLKTGEINENIECEDGDFRCLSPQNGENKTKQPSTPQVDNTPSCKLVTLDEADPSLRTTDTDEIKEALELKIEDIKMIHQHYDGLQQVGKLEIKVECEDSDFKYVPLQTGGNKMKRPYLAQIVDSPTCKLVKLDTSDPSNSTITTEEINEDFELKTEEIHEDFELKIEDIKMIHQHYDELQPIVKQDKFTVKCEDSDLSYASLQNSENKVSSARISDSKLVTLDESMMNIEEIDEALELKIEDTRMIHQHYDENQQIVEQQTRTVENQDNYFSYSSIQNEETDIEGLEIDIQDEH